MISVTDKQWFERKVNKNLIEKIKQDHSYSEIVSKLIMSRNGDSTEIGNISNNLEISNIFRVFL